MNSLRFLNLNESENLKQIVNKNFFKKTCNLFLFSLSLV